MDIFKNISDEILLEKENQLYEIHFTFPTPEDIDLFKAKLSEYNLKLIILEFQSGLNHIMSSERMKLDKKSLKDRIVYLIERLKNYSIKRIKIEIPANKNCKPDKNCYFESHIQVVIKKDEIENLKILANEYNFHYSRNVFKVVSETELIIMLTLRMRDGNFFVFSEKINRFKQLLNEKNYITKKIEMEFCIFDSNEELDKKWLNEKV